MSHTQVGTFFHNELVEYVVVGAGPAAICAIPNILNTGVSGKDILWIDPQFQVGDFGTSLSIGSSVPGNTKVGNYTNVFNEIYKMVPETAPQSDQVFKINNRGREYVCSLAEAAEPMQHITNKLRRVIGSMAGLVCNITTLASSMRVDIKLNDGSMRSIITKRVILATGASPKIMSPSLPNEVEMIPPNIVFIASELEKYLQQNPDIKTVVVIGSSHSAALATMHLLKAKKSVIQFMVSEYKFAESKLTAEGTSYTRYDNTGLKGDVGVFTKKLLSELELGIGEYIDSYTRYIVSDREQLNAVIQREMKDYSHAVAAIGYQASSTLQINNKPLSEYDYDRQTTAFIGMKGLFGIGIAFPQEVYDVEGNKEMAIGWGKFWGTTNHPSVLKLWAEINSRVVITPAI